MWVKSLNHMKGWTTGLALKMRPKVIRKWPNRETQWASARTWLKHDSDKQRDKETKINSVWRSFWYCSVNHFWFLHILSSSVQKPQVRARSTCDNKPRNKNVLWKISTGWTKKTGGGIFSHKPSQSQHPVGLHGAKKSGDPIGSLSTRWCLANKVRISGLAMWNLNVLLRRN